jgi:glycoprotein endo-alpha-1,2-mannosidase
MLGDAGPACAVVCRATVTGRRLSALVTAASCAALLAFPAASAPKPVSAAGGRVAIFYYPWYSTPARDGSWAHWYVEHDGAPVLSTAYYPARGLYSSSSARIVLAQMKEIAATGVDTVVVSWWGYGSPEAERLPLVVQAAQRYDLSVALHIEPYIERTPARAAEDITRLREETGITDYYLYDADRDAPEAWAAALESLTGVRIFGHTTRVARAKASGFDGVYTYDVVTWKGSMFKRLCGQARANGLLCAPSIGPGYDARLATRHDAVRDRQNGATYDRTWKTVIRARPDLVTITSYNEWQEGTQIEPARSQVGRAGYDGAWGKQGVAARRAYLTATARWTAKYRVALAK